MRLPRLVFVALLPLVACLAPACATGPHPGRLRHARGTIPAGLVRLAAPHGVGLCLQLSGKVSPL